MHDRLSNMYLSPVPTAQDNSSGQTIDQTTFRLPSVSKPQKHPMCIKFFTILAHPSFIRSRRVSAFHQVAGRMGRAIDTCHTTPAQSAPIPPSNNSHKGAECVACVVWLVMAHYNLMRRFCVFVKCEWLGDRCAVFRLTHRWRDENGEFGI